MARRQASTGPVHALYKTVFRSNIGYMTYIFVGAIALEYVYTSAIDGLWNGFNSGVSASLDNPSKRLSMVS
jgi:Trk-type K+ transport system membrane component